MLKRIRGSLLFLFIALLLLASGCASRSASQTPLVRMAAVSQKQIETRLDCSGVLVPIETVEIASKLSGQVVSLGFKAGDQVKRGELLIQLDTEALNGQLLAAQAGLQSAQASAQSAANQAAVSKINLDAAQLYFDRIQQLFAAGAVAQSTMDDAKDKLDIASQQYSTASGPALAQAEAAVTSAYANVKNLNIQLANTAIRSPIDGIVATQTINPGQVIAANTTVITVIDTSSLKLKTTVDQDRLPQLALGQVLQVMVDNYPGQEFSGEISSIGPIAVSTGEVFPLEITLKNGAGLLAGLSAHTTMINQAQGLSVPLSALQEDQGDSYVFVIADDKANRRVVRTGLQNDQDVLILEGLKEGEQVAITNLNALSDGLSVKPQ